MFTMLTNYKVTDNFDLRVLDVEQGVVDPEDDPVKQSTVQGLGHGVSHRARLLIETQMAWRNGGWVEDQEKPDYSLAFTSSLETLAQEAQTGRQTGRITAGRRRTAMNVNIGSNHQNPSSALIMQSVAACLFSKEAVEGLNTFPTVSLNTLKESVHVWRAGGDPVLVHAVL
ncbi:hypothetical protein EYF80_023822 [Liparis tanakae]|uniref:Uncharacterized protein n=1 Tax=Liparis tanakae TaxID=230148 RepID=A0A4Z2HJ65_9TELE|nr:hypothetical protein EYF80_023822 [Liparis tanakae]